MSHLPNNCHHSIGFVSAFRIYAWHYNRKQTKWKKNEEKLEKRNLEAILTVQKGK
jgi:hypothetical protein